jgi:hypothetical protein
VQLANNQKIKITPIVLRQFIKLKPDPVFRAGFWIEREKCGKKLRGSGELGGREFIHSIQRHVITHPPFTVLIHCAVLLGMSRSENTDSG